jgi:hypothetical protein
MCVCVCGGVGGAGVEAHEKWQGSVNFYFITFDGLEVINTLEFE